MSGDDQLIAKAQGFLAELAQNNTKAWWQENKATYDNCLKQPALALLDSLTPALHDLTGLPVSTKLFRPHRDVRFSKDKTPYHTHLHMLWQPKADAPQSPVFFFGISPSYVTAGAGLMGLDKPVLQNWRQMLDLDTDRMMGMTQTLETAGYRFREPELKRVPPPFASDHRAARFLRMKAVVASGDVSTSGALQQELQRHFRALWPLNDMLMSIAAA